MADKQGIKVQMSALAGHHTPSASEAPPSGSLKGTRTNREARSGQTAK